jgi:hypothetical protein
MGVLQDLLTLKEGQGTANTAKVSEGYLFTVLV